MTRRGRLPFRLLILADRLATRWQFHDTSQRIRQAYLTIAWQSKRPADDETLAGLVRTEDQRIQLLKATLTSQPALNAAHDVARSYPSVRSIHMADVLTAALEAVEDDLRGTPWTP